METSRQKMMLALALGASIRCISLPRCPGRPSLYDAHNGLFPVEPDGSGYYDSLYRHAPAGNPGPINIKPKDPRKAQWKAERRGRK